MAEQGDQYAPTIVILRPWLGQKLSDPHILDFKDLESGALALR